MGSPVVCWFYLRHHPFMACLDKKQYSKSLNRQEEKSLQPYNWIWWAAAPFYHSCKDGGSWLSRQPLSHQHIQHFVQHQTSSAGTYPDSLIAWILLLTWANPKFSRTQGFQPCTEQGAVTSHGTKVLPISNHTSIPTLATSFNDVFNLHKQWKFPQRCLWY